MSTNDERWLLQMEADPLEAELRFHFIKWNFTPSSEFSAVIAERIRRDLVDP